MSKLYTSIGLMSGTSLDGIDVALLRTDGDNVVERGPGRTYPYHGEQQAMLREAITEAKPLLDRAARPGRLAEIEWALTDWHAMAVEAFCREAGVPLAAVDLIGFHGQTVLHRPERRLTIQLGDGPRLARRLGRPVIYDLRADDIAAGGQGAPLVPVYHRALSRRLEVSPSAFVNIGGVANVTWIGRDGSLLAFDTGPGNALLDDWALRHTGRPADLGGRLAFSGRPDEATVAQFLGDSFFEQAPPKSLDRMSFAGISLDGLSPGDGAATLVAVTAGSIALARRWFPEAPRCWVICGGGRLNPAIMQAIRAALRLGEEGVIPAEALRLDGDAIEAEAWAYLAVRSLRELPITFPGTTGAPDELTGGVLAEP